MNTVIFNSPQEKWYIVLLVRKLTLILTIHCLQLEQSETNGRGISTVDVGNSGNVVASKEDDGLADMECVVDISVDGCTDKSWVSEHKNYMYNNEAFKCADQLIHYNWESFIDNIELNF